MRTAVAALVAPAVAIAVTTSGCGGDPGVTTVALEVVGCRPHPERGSGVVVHVAGRDGPLVVTAGHVVAGAREIRVTHDATTRPGTVVAFDPDMDLAYLAVDGLGGAASTIDSSEVDPGDTGTVHVVRDGVAVTVPVTVERRIRIRTEDVYVEGETLRPGFELRAAVEEGDSGGAVVVDGRVVGIVWARSRRAGDRAYAIDPVAAGELALAQLASGDLTGVDLTRCP